MIAELSAALTALKETTGLVKVINDAKNDAEIKAATFELNCKLIDLQSECFALGDVIRSRDEEVIHLKAKIAEYENFQTQVEGYVLNQLGSGAFVYSKQELVQGTEVTMHLCPLCYSKKIKSILHPFPVSKSSVYFQSRCLHCENKFLMDRNPAFTAPPTMAEIGRLLND
ncbi:hypothetical protein SAMN05216563_1264 [Phytobacter palmae]|nr:hypothetical protein SAMN05216563_1264 [Phytobacter palmae]